MCQVRSSGVPGSPEPPKIFKKVYADFHSQSFFNAVGKSASSGHVSYMPVSSAIAI